MKKLKPYLIFSIFLGVTACGGGSEEASQEIPAKKSQNMAPVAIIQSKNNPLPIVVGSAIVLDGSESTDDGSHALQYKWSVKPKPENGYAYIGPTNTNTFNFIPDTIGNYEVSLVVNDGKLDSPISVVSIDVVEKKLLNNLMNWARSCSVMGFGQEQLLSIRQMLTRMTTHGVQWHFIWKIVVQQRL
ncbi:MAG: hypothetical protein RR966_13780 [Acinetobacter sp.]